MLPLLLPLAKDPFLRILLFWCCSSICCCCCSSAPASSSSSRYRSVGSIFGSSVRPALLLSPSPHCVPNLLHRALPVGAPLRVPAKEQFPRTDRSEWGQKKFQNELLNTVQWDPLNRILFLASQARLKASLLRVKSTLSGRTDSALYSELLHRVTIKDQVTRDNKRRKEFYGHTAKRTL